MSTGLPSQIQILRAQASERSYSGQLSREDLPRLSECLAGPDVDVQVDLNLSRDHRGQRLAALDIRVRLELQCQRCLDRTVWQTSLNSQLLLLTDEGQGAGAEDHDSVLLEEGVLDIAALVEDEIMLALPIAPRHSDDSECGRVWKDKQAKRMKNEHPFAELAALKPKH